ncbi:uncharacterized protein SOCE26_054330 [Sorangium cellulosum]|uniref:Uncharacterized protein n=2 Tax=Sorangium cellulosum TaxID=56 RepID=A0A2L0EXH3_SORCE|nr:uncharacterized protein SOCE26_054330 [Sorangium cellulosum]
MPMLTINQGRGVAAALRLVALSMLATWVPIGCSSPVPPDNLPEPDPSQLILLYSGAPEYAPRCDPHGDGNLLWEGWVGTPGQEECEPCTCGPARCVLSHTVDVHSSSVCALSDLVSRIDPGSSWNGTCFPLPDPIPSDAYAFVTIHPPLVTDCQPIPEVPALRHTNMNFVRACGPDIDVVLTGFSRCYPPQPNGECWAGHEIQWEFPLYNDTRACSPCSCGEPSGGDCRVQTTLHSQVDCSEDLGTVLMSGLDKPLCTNTIQGRIGAVRSIFLKDDATCAPSTDSTVVSGTIEPGDTHVLCCNR